MAKQRISYVDPASLTDPAMLGELDRCRRERVIAGVQLILGLRNERFARWT